MIPEELSDVLASIKFIDRHHIIFGDIKCQRSKWKDVDCRFINSHKKLLWPCNSKHETNSPSLREGNEQAGPDQQIRNLSQPMISVDKSGRIFWQLVSEDRTKVPALVAYTLRDLRRTLLSSCVRPISSPFWTNTPHSSKKKEKGRVGKFDSRRLSSEAIQVGLSKELKQLDRRFSRTRSTEVRKN